MANILRPLQTTSPFQAASQATGIATAFEQLGVMREAKERRALIRELSGRVASGDRSALAGLMAVSPETVQSMSDAQMRSLQADEALRLGELESTQRQRVAIQQILSGAEDPSVYRGAVEGLGAAGIDVPPEIAALSGLYEERAPARQPEAVVGPYPVQPVGGQDDELPIQASVAGDALAPVAGNPADGQQPFPPNRPNLAPIPAEDGIDLVVDDVGVQENSLDDLRSFDERLAQREAILSRARNDRDLQGIIKDIHDVYDIGTPEGASRARDAVTLQLGSMAEQLSKMRRDAKGKPVFYSPGLFPIGEVPPQKIADKATEVVANTAPIIPALKDLQQIVTKTGFEFFGQSDDAIAARTLASYVQLLLNRALKLGALDEGTLQVFNMILPGDPSEKINQEAVKNQVREIIFRVENGMRGRLQAYGFDVDMQTAVLDPYKKLQTLNPPREEMQQHIKRLRDMGYSLQQAKDAIKYDEYHMLNANRQARELGVRPLQGTGQLAPRPGIRQPQGVRQSEIPQQVTRPPEDQSRQLSPVPIEPLDDDGGQTPTSGAELLPELSQELDALISSPVMRRYIQDKISRGQETEESITPHIMRKLNQSDAKGPLWGSDNAKKVRRMMRMRRVRERRRLQREAERLRQSPMSQQDTDSGNSRTVSLSQYADGSQDRAVRVSIQQLISEIANKAISEPVVPAEPAEQDVAPQPAQPQEEEQIEGQIEETATEEARGAVDDIDNLIKSIKQRKRNGRQRRGR